MQLRKAQDVDGNHPIGFRGGKTAKVSKKHIDKILKAHDHPTTKPVQKRLMRVAISKSPEHLANFANKLKEDYDAENVDSILNEATDKEVRMAKGIAFDNRYKGGNYTGAAKTIEKIRKGLSDHPSVKKALKRANEDTLPEETDDAGRETIHTRKADFKLSKVRLPDGRMVYRKVKKEIDIEK
jgi:hypothetical protein